MTVFNIHDAKTQFSKLVELVAAGEEVVIAKSGKPVARLVSFQERGKRRRLGSYEPMSRSDETLTTRTFLVALMPASTFALLLRRGTRCVGHLHGERFPRFAVL